MLRELQQELKLIKMATVKKYLKITNIDALEGNLQDALNDMNAIFSFLLETKRPDLICHTPYVITVRNLIEKNQWTKGTCVAISEDDGTLNLQLSFAKLAERERFPVMMLIQILFHEFRHKVQLYDENVKSVIAFPNWNNFVKHMMEKTGKSEDLINHIFHELNPAEVDAHIFASEMTGVKFNGNSFSITEESLKLLEKEKKSNK